MIFANSPTPLKDSKRKLNCPANDLIWKGGRSVWEERQSPELLFYFITAYLFSGPISFSSFVKVFFFILDCFFFYLNWFK